MNKVNNISIHFSLKNLNVDEISTKFNTWKASSDTLVDGDARDNYQLTVHYCIDLDSLHDELSKRIIEFLDSITYATINWIKTGSNTNVSRIMMFRNLNQLGGIAIFIGDADENRHDLELAKTYKVPIVRI